MSLQRRAGATMRPPVYFAQIKERASKRWDQLEADPEIAGPWHQLFKQVQSPRHILSELLQNADDAGASEARVFIEDDRFVFEHNGEDFSEANFGSICRFGYSNKRALHTIGFRGIGFKSTFSLGDRVELYSPTLAVAFERHRFTEPHWIDGHVPTAGTTRVEVAIASPLQRNEVEKNLDEWLKSSVSILFFKHIRRLQVRDSVVHWQDQGGGPVSNSVWMALEGRPDERFLLLRSTEMAFPPDALEEIRKERMLDGQDETGFPPCRVEILLGATGKLYVVLPTGVETSLPFACNAPFIQDPARLKIKEPSISPTNRWLLARAGELAASAMTQWLQQSSMSLPDRAAAYRLLPDIDRQASSIEGAAASVVTQAFSKTMHGAAIVLTETAELVRAKSAVAVPSPLFDVWSVERITPLVAKKAPSILCRHVATEDRNRLGRWSLVETFAKHDLFERLREQHLPRPQTWPQLLNLWAYIAAEVTGYRFYDADRLRINPVQGKDELYAAAEVVKLGEKLLQAEQDWEFLAEHLNVLDQSWTSFLTQEHVGKSEGGRNDRAVAGWAILKRIGLDTTSDASAVIERVAKSFFTSGKLQLEQCVQLAQIAAKLNANSGASFQYAAANLTLRSVGLGVLYDRDGQLAPLLPEDVRQKQILHPHCTAHFTSCSREEWGRWVSSGRSGLKTNLSPIRLPINLHSRASLKAIVQTRGLDSDLQFPYVSNKFLVEDWDFPDNYWQHWKALAQSDSQIWAKVVSQLSEHENNWRGASVANLLQYSTSGTTKPTTPSAMLPAWLIKLREKPCLLDTRGMPQLPRDLCRRTPATESLIEIESFVQATLDRENTRLLLDLLGVRSTPSGPGRLLDRLRALSKSERAPIQEVEKWYRRLDQLLDNCSTADTMTIRETLRTEKLILSDDGSWVTSAGVYLSGCESEVPGAAVIRQSVADLSLWRRIGVAEQPSAELALQWLSSLPSNVALTTDDARRVRSLQARFTTRIWAELGHWTNMLGEWVPSTSLSYSFGGTQSLARWNHLHDWVKRQTADFQGLPVETLQAPIFSAIPQLSEVVSEKLVQSSIFPEVEEQCTWLNAFGTQLARIELADPAETARTRHITQGLSTATWITLSQLEVLPYLADVPAGTSRLADVLWGNGKLYTRPLSKAKLAKTIPDEIGKNFSAEIRAALAYAFERSREDIRAYFEENFTLAPESDVSPAPLNDTDVAKQDSRRDPGHFSDEEVDGADDKQLATEISPTLEEEIDQDGEQPFAEDQPQDAAGETNDGPMNNQNSSKLRTPTRPNKQPIIARFAAIGGYKPDDYNRFVAANGSWIGRINGGIFSWEHRSSTGQLIRYYYPKEHCLDDEPLEIEAEVWGLFEQKPDLYSLILVNAQGNPVEISGARLKALRSSGMISIHPASYRLVAKAVEFER